MPALLKIILYVVMNYSDLAQIVKTIAGLIKSFRNTKQVSDFTLRLSNAIKEFEKSGSKKELEDLLCTLQKKC